jgi:carboxyl-terminal processing protease
LTLDEAVNLIRGPKGTKVKLTIYREGWSESKDFEIVRAVIEIPSLKWEMKDGIVYLKIYQFTEKAALDFARAAMEILAKPSQKMILDLRDNPGGYLEVAQDIAGWFLEKGEIVAIEDFGNGKTKEYKSEGPARFLDYKIVVLINQGSASGAEILAGALRDNRGILLIGEKSFGKGSVQEVENLKGGSSLKITVAKWLTPKGKSISETGLTPDIEVKMTEKDVEEGKDPQLEKAIEILKEMK